VASDEARVSGAAVVWDRVLVLESVLEWELGWALEST
jgi:hypothetical protein